ncbi:MAG: GtrA family protein [Clostridia bacterium]|nr:GtrA family protein [Clostridia bacterium]
MKKIKALYLKYKEIILYVFFGGLTTVINYAIYALMLFLNIDIYTSNIAAWIGAVLFAYLTNRKMVFNSEAKGKKSIIIEILSFYGSRVFSLAVETGLLFVCVSLMGMNEWITKLVLQVVVIVLNYIFSKFLVFRKKKK